MDYGAQLRNHCRWLHHILGRSRCGLILQHTAQFAILPSEWVGSQTEWWRGGDWLVFCQGQRRAEAACGLLSACGEHGYSFHFCNIVATCTLILTIRQCCSALTSVVRRSQVEGGPRRPPRDKSRARPASFLSSQPMPHPSVAPALPSADILAYCWSQLACHRGSS